LNASTATTERKPRYREMADELRIAILGGKFPEGEFPTESVLCKKYGVSRFTVREALRALQSEGLIARKRGSGTVVQPAAARGGALHQPLSNVAEILQYARDSRFAFDRLPEGGLPKSIAEQIGVVAGGRWFRFRGVRVRADDIVPIALTDAYVHADLAPVIYKIAPNEETIFRQIERLAQRKVARVTQDIQAVPASADVAAALGIARRSPCLRILRCYIDDAGKLFEISASHHPGDRFAYAMHIEVDT
jgi:GntR family transcriptional regulator